MKKKLWLFMGIMMAMTAEAQVIINLQLPPLGLTIKPQLWSLSLINTSNADFDAKIEMVMTDASNNQQVMSGITKKFLLPRGVKNIQLFDVMPITYNVGNPSYNIDPNPDGFLPIGLFNICYTVIKVMNDASERLTEECETIEIEPISPPQLVMPFDSERVEITRPFFTWLPPSPYNLFNNLNFNWVLVEVMPTQSPADAIQQNIPVWQQQNINFTSYQYPLSLSELDSSKRYAWRITAKNNNSPIATSEVWTFRVRKFGLDTVSRAISGSYIKLKSEEDASYSICNGVLRYEFLNEINSKKVEIRIVDISSPTRKQVNLDSSASTVKFGQNFIELDLRDYPEMKNGHIYLFELINVKNEHWFLKFEYRKPD